MCTSKERRWHDVHERGEEVARSAQARRGGGLLCKSKERRWPDVKKQGEEVA